MNQQRDLPRHTRSGGDIYRGQCAQEQQGCGCGVSRSGTGTTRSGAGASCSVIGATCSGCGGTHSGFGVQDGVLAALYIPAQCFGELYDLDTAICSGTLFRELDKPFLGGREGCGRGR